MSKKMWITAIVVCLASLSAFAQPQPPEDDGQRPPQDDQRPMPRGERRFFIHIKNQLGVTDEQWNSIQPKIEEVQKARRELGPIGGAPPMMMMGMGGPGMGRPGPGFGPGGGFGARGGRPPMRGNGAGDDGPNARQNATQPSPDDQKNADEKPPQGDQPGERPVGPPRGRAHDGPPLGQRSEVRERFEDLQDALDDKNTKPETLDQKIAAYREARKQAEQKLHTAQDELTKSLTPKQQAVLITAGLMD